MFYFYFSRLLFSLFFWAHRKSTRDILTHIYTFSFRLVFSSLRPNVKRVNATYSDLLKIPPYIRVILFNFESTHDFTSGIDFFSSCAPLAHRAQNRWKTVPYEPNAEPFFTALPVSVEYMPPVLNIWHQLSTFQFSFHFFGFGFLCVWVFQGSDSNDEYKKKCTYVEQMSWATLFHFHMGRMLRVVYGLSN